MKKILSIYIIKELIPPFLLGILIFTSIFLLGKLLDLVEMVLNKGVPFIDIIKIFFFILPSFFVFAVPLSFLLAVIIAFSRLSGDGEIIAMKAGGISLYQMYLPVFLFSIFAMLFTATITIYGMPWGNRNLKQTIFAIARTKAHLELKERVFNSSFKDMVIYIDRISSHNGLMKGIMIQDERDKDAINTIFAKEGRIIADETGQQVILRLTNGTIHRRDKKRGDYYIVSFEGYDLNLDFWGSISKKKFRMTRYEMSIKELSKRIKEEKERGEDYRELQVHLYSKFALPFVCIIFGIMGIPLGLKGKKSGKYLGIIISLVVVVFYYIIFSIAEVLGSRGNISPIVASWLPNILLAAFAIYIFLINAKEKESFLFNFIEYFFKRFERERDSK